MSFGSLAMHSWYLASKIELWSHPSSPNWLCTSCTEIPSRLSCTILLTSQEMNCSWKKSHEMHAALRPAIGNPNNSVALTASIRLIFLDDWSIACCAPLIESEMAGPFASFDHAMSTNVTADQKRARTSSLALLRSLEELSRCKLRGH
jgi:hypothetical protein